MKRPFKYDDYIIKAAAALLTNQLLRWAEAGESERLDYLDVAQELMEDAGFKNGYELAREMERKGYDCDLALVEILDDASSLLYDAHQNAVKKWVKGWNITVPFSLNDAVTIITHGRTVEGFVRSINQAEATCVVQCPVLGHVESGTGTHGLVMNYEDITPSGGSTQVSATPCELPTNVEKHGQSA